jgi:hypothetical protein
VIICLEGSDLTGKTTLARELATLGYRYIHNGPPVSDDMFEEYTHQIELVRSDENVVFDRLHLGELVYGPVTRGQSRLSLAQARLINRLIFGRGGLIVYCSAPPNEIIEGWKARREKEYVQSEASVRAIISGYLGLWLNELRDSSSVRRYSLMTWRNRARQFAQEMNIQSLSRVNLVKRGAIGEPTAKYLVVGEAPGGARDLAFYSMQNSSGFLNECLWRAGYKEHELLFTNARDLKGKERNLRLIHRDRQRTIALGRTAERACHEQDIYCVTAPHPQYVKRFKKNWYDQYVELLKSFKENHDEKTSVPAYIFPAVRSYFMDPPCR